MSVDVEQQQRSTREWFVELMCADDEWLRAEFDAIVAANFDDPPPSPRPQRPFRPQPSLPGRPRGPKPRRATSRPVVRVPVRQRSPP